MDKFVNRVIPTVLVFLCLVASTATPQNFTNPTKLEGFWNLARLPFSVLVVALAALWLLLYLGDQEQNSHHDH